jgi:aryl-phospho-beta-D-glucosidase BglC (GH1 family)
MKRKHLLAAAFAISTLAASAQKNFISVKGKEVIGVDGKPFQMRGTNLGNWLVPEGYMFKLKQTNSPRLINDMISQIAGPEGARKFWNQYLDNYITEKDIHFLKSIGVNSIRLPFHYKLFTGEDYLGSNDSTRGFRYTDRVIQWCKKEGMYVMLDMHCAPGGQTGDNIDDSYGYPFLFTEESSQQLTIRIWKAIAKRYKNETTVLGYDLLNEPIAHYFDVASINPYLEPLYKKITAAVRAEDKNHIILLGGAQWDSNFRIFGEPFDNKLVYTFHKYWTDTTRKVIQEYIDFSNKHNVPLYLGESGENTDQWIMGFRRQLDSNNIGWHFWPYKKMNATSSPVTFPQPETYSAVIEYSGKPRADYAGIRKAAPAKKEELLKALEGMLNNCRFENCTFNKGYIQALGFTINE